MENTPENKAERRARVVAYLRVSTDDQAVGLDAQRDAVEAYAAREGLDLVAINVDENISGAAPVEKRPALILSLSQLESGDILLVAKRDRLGRDPMIVGMIEATAIRKGARIVSIAGEGTDGEDPTSILMRRIIDAFAEFERLMIRTRTRAAITSLKKRNRVYGVLPYGFAAVDDGSATKTGGNPGRMVPDDVERKTIDLIVELASNGSSNRSIARQLDQLGKPTRMGRPWSHQVVRSILSRERGKLADLIGGKTDGQS